MARLTRKNIKVFAGNASSNGVFGSLQANNPTLTNDVEQLQSLDAWNEGWNAATETSEELPPLEEMQGVEYVTTYQQAYIMQEGLPEWAATVTYYKGSLIKEVTPNGFRIYCSLTNDNIGNIISDTANWKKVMDSEDLYAFDNTVVHKTSAETITGVKTFSTSPLVPNVSSGDSSTKSANTAFVTSAANSLQTQINQKANTSAVVTLTGTQSISGTKTFLAKTNMAPIELYPVSSGGSYIDFHYNNSTSDYTSRIWEQASGDLVVTANNFTINANGYARASDVNGSIVTTVNKSKSANGYFKLGNGLIIQWGVTSTGGGDKTVTLPTAFTSTNYSVSTAWSYDGSLSSSHGHFTIKSHSTTNFVYHNESSNAASFWIAIGY